MKSIPDISLVVATLGRDAELIRLLESLSNEREQVFEVIIADQNDDDRVVKVLEDFQPEYRVIHHRLTEKNASHARNIGAGLARGKWLAFPDDDCCYTGDTISWAKRFMHEDSSPLLCGAILDFDRQYHAKSLSRSSAVSLQNIRGKMTEPALFISSGAFFKLRGFDTSFGPGSANYAGEGLELGLRALKTGFSISYHTEIEVLHKKSIPPFNEGAMKVGYRYSYSNALAIRKHYKFFAWYFVVKQCLLLPARNLLKRYPADKRAYYFQCLKGLIDGALFQRSRQ